jgi:succinate dehydrogenase / fumarate reductase flavoprotein subunit
MTASFGIFREERSMHAGMSEISSLRTGFQNAGIEAADRDFNQAVVRLLELDNMLLVAETVAVGAIARRESRGSHFRTDFPSRNDAEFLKHTVTRSVNGTIQLSHEPVRLGRYPVKERTY